MKLTADREALHTAFQHVGGVITSAISKPIYENVKLEAKSDGVFLSATDLEVGLRIRANKVEVEEEGSVLVPENRVARLLRTTPDDTITLEGDSGELTLISSDGHVRILGQDPEDFADIPPLPEGEAIEMDPVVLRYMVNRTTFATAEEKGRYALNGVLIQIDEEGTFEMVAADGARLADVTKKASNPVGEEVDSIVMKKGIVHAARLGELSDEPLRIQVTENQFLAENSAGRMSCQLVEGQFPNYREVIPRDNKNRATLPTQKLLNALRRASYLTSKQTRAVDFEFTEDNLVLKSQSPDLGDAELRIDVEYRGEDTEIAFNPQYIEDMLETVERESVKLEFNDKKSPCLVRSGVDFQYVVSPVVREEAQV